MADADLSCCPPLGQRTLDANEAAELAAVLKALSDPVRLRVVSTIAASSAGEVCACDLPAVLDRTQSTVSHHLSVLVDAGLIHREQRGKWAWFRLDRQRLESVRAALSA